MDREQKLRVGVMGAGSIGGFLGGRLAAAGVATTLVGRNALGNEIARHGLRTTDYDGRQEHVPPDGIRFSTEAEALRDADVVLVTVKSQDTAGAAAALAPYIREQALVVSFQNGVHNADLLRAALPGHTRRVLAGMVPYNVLRQPEATFHRGVSGELVVERTADGRELPLLEALEAAGLSVQRHDNVAGVQWGKLLINLNNAINALSGLPLRDQLAQRGYRRIMAAAISEALGILRAAGIRPISTYKAPLAVLPWVLRLPDALFLRVAGSMVRIDPQARSSMWEDLERRRPTEIDYLNGEIVRLAEAQHGGAPLNTRIVECIRQAERAGVGSTRLPAVALAELLGV